MEVYSHMPNQVNDPGTLFVCLMGVGIVFVGLISLVAICKIMGIILQKISPANENVGKAAPSASQTVPSPAAEPIQNRQELIAAIAAAIAEENGTDVSGIKILSVKKI